jgi:hypothetical protein
MPAVPARRLAFSSMGACRILFVVHERAPLVCWSVGIEGYGLFFSLSATFGLISAQERLNTNDPLSENESSDIVPT